MKGRINKRRQAPSGYVAIDKNLARELYEKGIEITMAGNNVNSFHIFGGWALGYTPSEEFMECRSFAQMLDSFRFYQEPELGRYPVFYTRKENITK